MACLRVPALQHSVHSVTCKVTDPRRGLGQWPVTRSQGLALFQLQGATFGADQFRTLAFNSSNQL